MKNSTPLIIVVVILVLLGAWYLLSHKQTAATGTTTVTTVDTGASSRATTPTPAGTMETGTVNTTVTASSSVGAAHVDNLAVAASSFAFAPKTLTVKKGDHVKITVSNTGGTHDFVIDELNVHSKMLNTGDTATVEFDATKAGTFTYYCSVGNHRSMGMEGTLTVTQ